MVTQHSCEWRYMQLQSDATRSLNLAELLCLMKYNHLEVMLTCVFSGIWSYKYNITF